MGEINLLEFYDRVVIPLSPSATVSRLLTVSMSGVETTDDITQALAKDTELQHWVRLTVTRLGFEKHASKLLQATILLGQNRIRDLILGRSIERAFVPESDTLLARLHKEKEKSKPKDAPKPKKVAEAAPEKEIREEEEVVPALADFRNYLEYAVRAEEIAISIRNSYPGQAFAGGVIFDYVRQKLKWMDLSALQDPRVKNSQVYTEEIFKDGVRCGIAANEIMQKISIPHQKNAFVTALVHNIGKLLLLVYKPVEFEKAFLMSTGAPKGKERVESDEAEGQFFELDHAQVGSLFLGRLPFLAEIERSVDYHHNPHLLKFSNPKLYALACVLRISGALAKLYQKSRADNPDTDKIRDQRLKTSEDFQFLRLTDEEWSEIKANYALKLMKTGY